MSTLLHLASLVTASAWHVQFQFASLLRVILSVLAFAGVAQLKLCSYWHESKVPTVKEHCLPWWQSFEGKLVLLSLLSLCPCLIVSTFSFLFCRHVCITCLKAYRPDYTWDVEESYCRYKLVCSKS